MNSKSFAFDRPYFAYYVAMSVDGFIARSNGDVDWLAPFESGGEDYGYHRFFTDIDGLVMGRKTFEQIRSFDHWPYEKKPCWVFAGRKPAEMPATVTWSKAGPEKFCTMIRTMNLKRIWLVGGARLAAEFAKAGLIDEYVITVIPVFLGRGISLIDFVPDQPDLILKDQQTFPQGITQLRFLTQR